MRRLDGITDLIMNVSLSKRREIVKDRKAWCPAVHGVTNSRTRPRDRTSAIWLGDTIFLFSQIPKGISPFSDEVQKDTGHPLQPHLPLTFSFRWRTLHPHPEGDVGRSGSRGHGRKLLQWLRRGWSSESDPQASTLHPPGRAGSSSSCERRKAQTLQGSWRWRVCSLHPGHERKFAQPHLGATGQDGRSALGDSGQESEPRTTQSGFESNCCSLPAVRLFW